MNAAQIEVINTLTENLNELRRAQENRRGIMCDSGWVVHSAGFYCAYTFGEKGAVLTVKAGGILSATKMSEVNARHLATETKNGTGIAPYAIHVNDALKKEIATLEKLLKTIEENTQK